VPREVTIAIDGNLIAVTPINETVCRPLEKALTYTQIKHIRGKEAYETGKRIQFVRTACYRYKPDANPTRLITNFGFMPRLVEVLKKYKYKVRVVDHRPNKRQHVFVPQWDRLGKVAWRHRQQETIQAILDNPCGRIDCPTGYGKSFIIVQLARILPKANIDVVVRSTKIARDIYSELCTHLPEVGIVGANKKRVGRRITVYTADSLQHSSFEADIVLADEGHELAAPTYLKKLARYRFSRMYMFSASQSRPDKRDFELEGVFGPIIMHITYQEARENKMVVPIEVRIRSVKCPDPCGSKTDTAKERAGIWRNAFRNKLIADDANSYPDDQVLIVCTTVEHAIYLKKLLPDFSLVYAENGLEASDRERYVAWGLIAADEPYMTSDRKLALEKEFEAGTLRKVIATTVWNRGVNFHQLQVLIRADGGGSPIGDTQIPGRVCRLYDDKTVGIVHDYEDEFNDGYYRKSLGRRKNYEKKGWKIVDLDKPQSEKRRIPAN